MPYWRFISEETDWESILSLLSNVLVVIVALLHVYIMVFEMFLWTKRGPKIFRSFPTDLFEPTKTMAANQGLYNGFLAAGLLWSVVISDPVWQKNVALCFLVFVLVAGIYGALTVEKRILFVQSVPALLGILSILVF